MPELFWLYLTALLYDRTSASCVALAEALEAVSHDRLTRLLQAAWSGQTLLELAFRTLFVWATRVPHHRRYGDSQALRDCDGGPSLGLLQLGAPTSVWLSPGAARVDRWAASDPLEPAPLAPRGPFEGHVGLGVAQLCP
jgi:hypothetical protein